MYRDVVDMIEAAGDRLDTVLIPKVGVPSDVYLVDALLTQIETAKRFPRRIGLEVLIETALGMANVEAIAQSSPRLEAMHFGVADYAASMRARTVSIGGLNPDYPGDQWHAAISRMTVACRAYGLRAIDGPFGDFKDPAGFTLAARRAAALGIEGKWAIHPSQIDLANDIFTPSPDEVKRAERILEAIREAEAQGRGAAQLDGKMIDAASARMAQNIVDMAAAIRRAQQSPHDRRRGRLTDGHPRIPGQGAARRVRRARASRRRGLHTRSGRVPRRRDRRRPLGGEGPDSLRCSREGGRH